MGDEQDDFINKNSKLGKLIIRVQELEKCCVLDNSLSEILDSFLRKLKQSEDFLVNGIFQLNFAEAALLLQSSALVYSKKVDLLWDSVNQCQKRMISYDIEKNKDELNKVEEREQKYKRRRKVIELPCEKDKSSKSNHINTFQIDWTDVNDFQNLHYEKDSRLYSRWFKKMSKTWEPHQLNRGTKRVVEKYSHFRGSENSICDKDEDDEFVVQIQKMESVMNLDNLLLQHKPVFSNFSFKLFEELYILPKFLFQHQIVYDDAEKYAHEYEIFVHVHQVQQFSNNTCGRNVVKSSSSPELIQHKLRRISISSTIQSQLAKTNLGKVCFHNCQVNMTRLSIEDLCRLSRLSIEEIKSISHNVEKFKPETFQESECLDKKIETGCNNEFRQSNISALEKDAHSICPNEPSELANKDIDDLNISQNISSKIIEDSHTVADENGNLDSRDDVNNDNDFANENSIEICEISSDEIIKLKQRENRSDRKKIRILEIDEEIPVKKRKMSKAALKKLATGITVDLREFSIFFATHYNAEEGEGQVDIPLFEIDDPINSSSRIDPNEVIPSIQDTENPIIGSQDSGYVSRVHDEDNQEEVDLPVPLSPIPAVIPESGNLGLEESGVSLGENDNAVLEQSETASNSPCVQAVDKVSNEEKPLFQRVCEWKQHMSEKFKTMTSSDFDIHDYGSGIMESFDSSGSKKFGEIVRGKSAAEVTRFFISALQLANTCNIEIEGAQDGKLSNDSLSLKLITKERYYDRLKSYVAPSQEDYHERLATAHRLKKKHCNRSSECPTPKRSKYE